jgi:hypothetical protein
MTSKEFQDRIQVLASEMVDLIESQNGEGWLAAIESKQTTWSVMIADSPMTGVELMETYVSSLDK